MKRTIPAFLLVFACCITLGGGCDLFEGLGTRTLTAPLVAARCVAQIGGPQVLATAPLTARFFDHSAGCGARSWDNGAGATSAIPDPVFSFPACDEAFSVTLHAWQPEHKEDNFDRAQVLVAFDCSTEAMAVR